VIREMTRQAMTVMTLVNLGNRAFPDSQPPGNQEGGQMQSPLT